MALPPKQPHQQQTTGSVQQFLTRDTLYKRELCRRMMSVTRRYCVETAKVSSNFFHRLVATTFKFFTLNVMQYSDALTGHGMQKGMKNNLRPMPRFISDMTQDTTMFTVEGR